MKSLAVRLSLLPAVLFFIAFVTPIAWAQDSKPLPESPPPESKPEPPPSPPAEAPRSEPPPSPPAAAPRSEPPPSPPAASPRSDPAPNSGGSRNNDGGSSRGNNDNRRNDNDRRTNEDGGRVRGSMSGDGSGNRRDRVIETESGEVIVPGRTGRVNPTGVTPGGVNPGGNPGGNPTTGGGNPRGNPGGRHRDRDRDRDRDRWRDRHGDRRGHRHYRGDECYQVPTYDDTVSYSAASYPDYDRDDSLSAYDRGYNDGLYTGANDGRRGQTYDPERSHLYMSGTDGYRSSKGSRDAYKLAYRDGFLRGYREGYQNWQKYFVGGRFRR